MKQYRLLMHEVAKCLFAYTKSKLKKSRFFSVYKKTMKCSFRTLHVFVGIL